jgi:hypothetical protein
MGPIAKTGAAFRSVRKRFTARHTASTVLARHGDPDGSPAGFPAKCRGVPLNASSPIGNTSLLVIVGLGAIISCSLSLANDIFSVRHGESEMGLAEKAKAVVTQKIHMDIVSKTAHLPGSIILVRGFLFFGWMVAFLCSMAVIGLIPTVPIFVIAYMRLEGPEKWRHAVLWGSKASPGQHDEPARRLEPVTPFC